MTTNNHLNVRMELDPTKETGRTGATLCSKWEKCNAPICPLDPGNLKRVMLNEDAVCFYLSEAVKTDAEAIFRGAGRRELYELVSQAIPPLSARWGRIRRALERAKLNGSRMTRTFPSEEA
jgi:hypothetical protein